VDLPLPDGQAARRIPRVQFQTEMLRQGDHLQVSDVVDLRHLAHAEDGGGHGVMRKQRQIQHAPAARSRLTSIRSRPRGGPRGSTRP